MKRKLFVAGLLAFVVGLIAFLPARVVVGMVEANAEGLHFGGVSGTLFEGRALYASAPQASVQNLHWNLQPSALLTGRLAVSMDFDTDLGGVSGTAAYTLWGTTTLSDLHGSATLDWLGTRAGYTFLPVSGDLTFDIEHLALGDNFLPAAIEGQLRLSNVYWQLMRPALQLGSYAADLSQVDGRLQATLADSSGPLAIKGQASVTPDSGAYSVSAQLRARASADERLKNLLSALGQADNAGWYRIRQQGRL